MKTVSAKYNIRLKIDTNSIIHKMSGGIGASWHAISKEIQLNNEKYDYPVRLINPRGSAYGGNPPLSNHSAWKQIFFHAKWLGLNFIRVELSQRMYEPQRNKFDWKNEEMSVLYKILDWCEENNVDVFLQQMWSNVEWNAYPGIHPLLSAPNSLEDFAKGISTLLKYLIKIKKYTCIKYFCITNEPPQGTWGYWWSYGSGSGSVTPALKKVRNALDANGITISLSGPDWTDLPPFDKNKIDFDKYVGAYDIHSYSGIDKNGEKILKDWVRWSAKKKKPFFLTEFGNMNLGWGAENPQPKSFAAALSNASDVICGMNLGVDAFNRWSFTNRGDLDGQWQLIRTWDINKKKYLDKIIPEKYAYFGFAMLTRFTGKYSSVLKSETDKNINGFKCASLKSMNKNITVIIVNGGKAKINLNITIQKTNARKRFNLYQVTNNLLDNPKFKLNPLSQISGLNNGQGIILPPESITVLSTFHLLHEDSGIIE